MKTFKSLSPVVRVFLYFHRVTELPRHAVLDDSHWRRKKFPQCGEDIVRMFHVSWDGPTLWAVVLRQDKGAEFYCGQCVQTGICRLSVADLSLQNKMEMNLMLRTMIGVNSMTDWTHITIFAEIQTMYILLIYIFFKCSDTDSDAIVHVTV